MASDAGQPVVKSPPSPVEGFVVLPDTQYYSCGYPDIFLSQTMWIVDNVDTAGIGLVLHTGDIVDVDISEEWMVASEALHMLDDHIRYMLVPGNHDLHSDRTSMLDKFFSGDELMGTDRTNTGFLDEQQIANSYVIGSLQGQLWLFIGLEFAPRDSTLAWANSILQQHSDVPAVLFTHAYLYSDGVRYDRRIEPRQPYHPDEYRVTPEEGIADGQDIWDAVVEPNENVKLVLSGHVIPDGTARSVAVRQSGSRVHQVLANYQSCAACPCAEAEGGAGFLRRFTLELDGSAFRVETYSPHRDEYLRDEENEFVLAL